MENDIELRFESRELYETIPANAHVDSVSRPIGGYLSIRRAPGSPLETIELDEDSFFLAYSSWNFFLYYSLSSYASKNTDKLATVYTFSTGQSPSVNYSHGEKHKELGWHNAVFFGVVGRKEVLQVIKGNYILRLNTCV